MAIFATISHGHQQLVKWLNLMLPSALFRLLKKAVLGQTVAKFRTKYIFLSHPQKLQEKCAIFTLIYDGKI